MKGYFGRFLLTVMLVGDTVRMVADVPVTNAGFESPSLPVNQFQYRPPGFNWTFLSASGVANGNGSWGTGAHGGQQYVFIQSVGGSTGQISQQVANFVPGQRYIVQFWMSPRNGNAGGNNSDQRIGLLIDGTPVGGPVGPIAVAWHHFYFEPFMATAATHTVGFVGKTIASGDQSALLDDVSIVPYMLPSEGDKHIRNGDFEFPNFDTSGWSYNPQVVDVGWTFLAFQGAARGSGIASIGSPWGASAKDGKQFAFVQRDGFLTQTMSDLIVGNQYQVRFALSSRAGFPEHFVRVLVDGAVVLGPVSASGQWQEKVTQSFTATDTSMTLKFAGILGGVDAASLIDSVTVVPEPVGLLAVGVGAIIALRRRR